ncbi:MAG: tRNA (adenosine(37)-N6)-threonylcarbamoyltransferase complex ATPase subunit type 1 TsaE [Christensenellales bacterium]|jgi:tRNA threonylcarbamoyladenosine biosynthesis protein TsaE
MVIITHNPEETEQIAIELGRRLKGGEVLSLLGGLGAGKTTFAKGIAKALDITDTVTSPTFTIMNSYKGRLNLYHYDMYRIQDEDELSELGIRDYLYSGGVSVIEWNKFDLSGLNVIHVTLEYLSENSRRITIV